MRKQWQWFLDLADQCYIGLGPMEEKVIGTGTNWRDSAMKHRSTVVKQIPDNVSAGVSARRNQSGSGYRGRRSKRAERFKRDIFS
jgi:hypothetical protein